MAPNSTDPERQIAERFARETARHQMTVLHDDGLYRHLRFSNRPMGHYGEYWFDLVTVPHALIFQGDGESFVFSRLEDMFQFFRGRPGSINPSYWAEKLTSDRDSVKVYDEDLFKQRVREEVQHAIEQEYVKPQDAERFREEVEDEVLDDCSWEDGARQSLDGFVFYGTVTTQDRALGKSREFRFEDTWEWSFRDYDWWFLWALHGIVWGIRQYDRVTRYGLQSLATPKAVAR